MTNLHKNKANALRGGGTAYHGRYAEAPSERGTLCLFQAVRQVYEMKRISLVEVYERAGNSVILVLKKTQKE